MKQSFLNKNLKKERKIFHKLKNSSKNILKIYLKTHLAKTYKIPQNL